jgi:hypothetical protein
MISHICERCKKQEAVYLISFEKDGRVFRICDRCLDGRAFFFAYSLKLIKDEK